MTDTERHDEARLTMSEAIGYIAKRYSYIVSRQHLRYWIESDRLPFSQPFGTGGRILIRRADIDERFAAGLFSEKH